MVRPRLWVVQKLERIAIEERERFLSQLHTYIKASGIRARLRQDWDLFLVLNNFDACPRALELFVADMALALSESTVAEYTMKLSSLPALKLPAMRGCWTLLTRLLNVRAADADTKRALNITHGECQSILKKIDWPYRGALAAMALLGPRAADVVRLRRSQLDVPWLAATASTRGVFYRAQIRVAKNRKRLGRRVNLYVPAEWRMPLQSEGNFLHKALREYRDEDRPFASCTTTSLNRAIARACIAVGLPRCTTYSFRRLFISEIIRHCKRDFAKVRTYTLHFAEETVRAYYDSW